MAEHLPASFVLRLLAKMADLLVLSAMQLALFCAFALTDALGWAGLGVSITLLAVYFLSAVGYFAFFSSRGRQTWGYRLAGIRVVTDRGEAVGGWRSFGRAFLDLLALATLQYIIGLLDYLPIAVTRSKRAVHDLLTRTAVVRVGQPRQSTLALWAAASVAAPFVLVFGVVRPCLLQAFYMAGGSMAPTLQANDRFIVNKLPYRLHPIRHEDVIVFAASAKVMAGHPDFPKRVAGLPGDVVQVVRGRVIINGQEFNHQVVRDSLGHAGLFGSEAMSAAVVSQAEHHVKFVPNGVFADGQFVSKSRLAQFLSEDAHARVVVVPGYLVRNGEPVAEPFAAEDPDYDLRFAHGQPLTHRYDTDAMRDDYEQGEQEIAKADYEREAALPEERVPAGQLVVFGDNRNDSRDSAEWGYLSETTVEGKATWLFLPHWQRVR